jgi:hypothetical protein
MGLGDDNVVEFVLVEKRLFGAKRLHRVVEHCMFRTVGLLDNDAKLCRRFHAIQNVSSAMHNLPKTVLEVLNIVGVHASFCDKIVQLFIRKGRPGLRGMADRNNGERQGRLENNPLFHFENP